MANMVSAVFEDQKMAARAVGGLRAQGFDENSFLLVARGDDGRLDQLREEVTRNSQRKSGAKLGSVAGASVGGSLGIVLTSFALLPAIPLAALGGALIGAAAGAASGTETLVSDQIDEVKEILAENGAVVFVQSQDSQRLRHARELLLEAQASQVSEPVSLPQTPPAITDPGD